MTGSGFLRSGCTRGLFVLVGGIVGGACAQRSTEVVLPLAETGARKDSGVHLKLDAYMGNIEAGAGYDGIPGCPGIKELCNGLDDDCDGVADNGFDLASDPANCGACGNLCSAAHATAGCAKGQCVVGACIAGYVDVNGSFDDGCECMRSNGGVELCDGADNDCDGVIDNGFDLQNDPSNCGACGKVCSASNATPSCRQAACGFTCNSGFYDANKQAGDGCEYACTPSANPTEVCDGIDNDCNGLVDAADPGVVYTPADRICYSSAAGSCQAGILTCIAGQLVCVGAGPPSVEICDGRDNNCDGQIDESDPHLGNACYAPGVAGCDASGGACKGLCTPGAYVCTGGSLLCSGAVTPTLEVCDGKDNDCDGVVDNGFDTDTDPGNCGGCGHACSFAHAFAACVQGVCVLDPKHRQGACAEGWVDKNGDPADGCEHQCTVDGPEVCDGRDNDCDGLVDNDDPGLVYPSSNFCSQIGECGKGPGGSTHVGWESSGSFPVCGVPAGAAAGTAPMWVCNYPATVELAAPNQVAGQETWCDGKDNDCNGVVDDPHVATLGSACADPASSALGACLRRGTIRCQADKTLPAACDLSGSPPAATPTDEICDGIDNDCDGLVDESWDNPPGLPPCGGHDCLGVREEVVHVSRSGAPGGGYYIYKYEASRVDASAAAQGTSSARACSRALDAAGAHVLPWSTVTWNQADQACRAAGMRLCRVVRAGGAVTSDEWGFACVAGQSCTSGVFPYACSYSATACNGLDLNRGSVATCGSLAGCITVGDLDPNSSSDQVFDLSGNLAEWTDDRRDIPDTGGSPPDAGGATAIYTTRGGAFDSFFTGLACDFMGTQVHPTFSYPDTGFRCCSSCAPGQADCAGTCVNLASNAANCGGCGVACGAGTTCTNGVCK